MNPKTWLLAALVGALSVAVAGNRTCVPIEPTAPAAWFTGASASYGECLGACHQEVAVDGSALDYLARSWQGVVYSELAAALTPAGQERAEAIAAALVGVPLEPRYGCPDCADGGTCTVSLVRAGVASTHAYDCSFGPPPVLADAHAFWQGVLGALAECRSTAHVSLPADCVPIHGRRCEYGGQVYEPGDSFPAGDGCNTCVCDADGRVACTEIACPAAYFTGASAHYGFCWGPCRSDLGVDGAVLDLLVTGHDGEVFRRLDGDLSPILNDAGLARARELAAALVGVELRPVYGCPDCADGGECALAIVRDGVASTHRYDCSGGPPAVLADAHEFWQGIIRDLQSCEVSPYYEIPADFECVPLWP